MSDSNRYTPYPLPPYTYVPGKAPHPLSDPAGHGCPGPTGEASLAEWPQSDLYLWGIDLFNHGYYWESHEVWESIWHSVGRQGTAANFIKGLIKLAAAGVKAHEGNDAGLQRHLRRSLELMSMIDTPRYGRMQLGELRVMIARLARDAPYPRLADPARPIATLGVKLQVVCEEDS